MRCSPAHLQFAFARRSAACVDFAFTKKRGPGTLIDNRQTPRPDEIAVIFCLASGGRLNPRSAVSRTSRD